jgi:hypothetical protein
MVEPESRPALTRKEYSTIPPEASGSLLPNDAKEGNMRRIAALFVMCGAALTVCFTGCRRNQPPADPQLSGPTLGKPGATLTYTFTTTDPENQEVAYSVAWGDTSAIDWSSIYASGQQVVRSHSYADSGVYSVKVKARDTRLAESEWSNSIVVSIGFLPPDKPEKPSGPASCTTGIDYAFTARTTHPQGDSVWLQFDWGGIVGNWGGPVASDSQFHEQHVFNSVGTFSIMVRAKDARGRMSTWSEPLAVQVAATSPTVPTMPAGPDTLDVGQVGSYSTSSTDPNGDMVRYVFDWGDGNVDTSALQPSGVPTALEHSWFECRSYDVTASAQDSSGHMSGWSSPLTVTVSEKFRITAAGERGSGGTETNFTYEFSHDADLTMLTFTFPGYAPVDDPDASGPKSAGTTYHSDGWNAGGINMPTGIHYLEFSGTWQEGAFDVVVEVDVD